jgi:hypothetical protein
MPLLEINQIRHISASVRLDEATAAQVDQYAAFIHASADDVVDKALNYVFSKDHYSDLYERAMWRQPGAAEEPAKKLVLGWSQRFCAGSEGVILHSISWWSKNGASHRKKL